jgi:hypothetical protein
VAVRSLALLLEGLQKFGKTSPAAPEINHQEYMDSIKNADLCRDFFSRAVALELSFFEAAYTI